jgi:cytosine permease
MANGSVPSYLATAKPVPASARAPWFTNTAQSYAGIFLWIAFFDQLAGADTPGALSMAGLGMCLLGLVVAGLLAVFLFYYVPGLLGMKTGLPLYIVGTSTFGTHGGYFLPGVFMGLLQIGWYSVATYFAAMLVLQGLGLDNYATSIYGAGGQFSIVFVGTTILWGYLFALIGALGIGYVAKVATFFPIVPIVMLIVAAVYAAPTVGDYTPAASEKLPGFLLIIQLVIGFFATAGAVGADFCSNNRDENDVRWGGIVGVWLPILFAGGLALVVVAGAHGKDPTLENYGFSACLPAVSPTLEKYMLILFAIGSVAPACFCSFIIGNSLSTMLGSEKTRIPLTLGGATIGIILAALGVAGNLAPFFGLIGASFGPVIGAMIADYVRNGGKWPGPRAGVSVPGYAAWLLGFIVGILGHPWVAVLPGWHIASVYSLIVGFVVYYLLASIGLEPATVELANLKGDQADATDAAAPATGETMPEAPADSEEGASDE